MRHAVSGDSEGLGRFQESLAAHHSARNGRLMGTAKTMSSKVNNNRVGARSFFHARRQSFPVRISQAVLEVGLYRETMDFLWEGFDGGLKSGRASRDLDPFSLDLH